MNIIIAGGRDFNDEDYVIDALNQLIENGSLPDESSWTIISGMARGADSIGAQLAIANNIPLIEIPAKWGVLGKSAGYIRNTEMAEKADVLVAFWDGKSKGTKHMITTMKMLKKKFFVYYYNQ